jgi:general secretion pathway protein K
MSPRLPHQRGIALITALLIVALATLAAVAMASRQQLDIRRSANLLNGAQALQFALGVESWAQQVLTRQKRKSNVVHLNQDWATQLPPMEVEGGQIAGQLVDLQGRFNLNRLLRPDGQPDNVAIEQFQRLITQAEGPPELAYAVLDWIDSNIDADIRGGAEDTAYALGTPPYRSANAPMNHPSELLQVKGMTAALYRKLAPYLTALPSSAITNVNTAPEAVLMCLMDGLSANAAKELVTIRGLRAFATVDAFVQQLSKAGVSADDIGAFNKTSVGVNSSYFLLHAETRFGAGRTRLYSVITRGVDGKSKVITRSLGVY